VVELFTLMDLTNRRFATQVRLKPGRLKTQPQLLYCCTLNVKDSEVPRIVRVFVFF
jgi:hypothetical protein